MPSFAVPNPVGVSWRHQRLAAGREEIDAGGRRRRQGASQHGIQAMRVLEHVDNPEALFVVTKSPGDERVEHPVAERFGDIDIVWTGVGSDTGGALAALDDYEG